MKEADVLRELFDEKIIKILNVFLDSPKKRMSLSETSSISKVHITTTFRIVNKLLEKEYLRVIVVGKSKFYQLKNNNKTLILLKFLKKENPEKQ